MKNFNHIGTYKFLIFILLFGVLFYFKGDTAYACCTSPDPSGNRLASCGSNCSASQCNATYCDYTYYCRLSDCTWQQNSSPSCSTNSCQDPCPCGSSGDDDDDDDDDDDTTPNYMRICGYVTNQELGTGIPNVSVNLLDSAGNTVTKTTNAAGFFESTSDFDADAAGHYAVRLPTTSLPVGYVARHAGAGPTGELRAGGVLGYTWWDITNRDTRVSDVSYENQQFASAFDCSDTNPNNGNDCRCNFEVVPMGGPTNLNVAVSCDYGVFPPEPYMNVTWREGIPNPTNYVVRVNYDDCTSRLSCPPFGEWANVPYDKWIAVPDSRGFGYAGVCNGTTCSLRVPWNAEPLYTGHYWGLGVESAAAENRNGPPDPDYVSLGDHVSPAGQTDYNWPGRTIYWPAFDVPACIAYDITGTFYEIDSSCSTPGVQLHTVADVSGVELNYVCSGVDCSSLSPVSLSPGDSDSAYSFVGLPPVNGTLSINQSTLNHDTISGITYELGCYRDSSGWHTLSGISSVQFNPLSSDEVIDFGYVLNNPYEDGWLTSLNGDVFGGTINSEIPDSPLYVRPFLSQIDPSFDSIVFTDVTTVDDDKIAEEHSVTGLSKYVKNFQGSFWPQGFSFNPPADAVQINASQLQNGTSVKAGEVYTMTDVHMRNFLDSANPEYNIDGPGVAVIFVLDTNNPAAPVLEFSGKTLLPSNPDTNQFTLHSNAADERILIYSQKPITIKKEVGYTIGTVPANFSTSRAHLEAGIVSKEDITFETIGSGGDDRVVLLEGPFVAGDVLDSTDPSDTLPSINMLRNLNLYNIQHPAAMVRYNPIYLTQTPRNQGIYISDITWIIEE